MRPKKLVSLFSCFFFGNIPLSKALITFCVSLRIIIEVLRVRPFFSFLTDSFGFAGSLKTLILSFNLICCSSASPYDKSLLQIYLPKDGIVLLF